MIYGRKVVRIAVEGSQVGATMTDVFTGGPLTTWRNCDTEFDLAFFLNSILLAMTNYSSIKLEVFATETAGLSPLMSKTISSGNINTGLTLGNWQAGTDQHVVVPFTAAECDLDLGGKTQATFWLVISGITTDSPSHFVILGGGSFQVVEGVTPTNSLGPVQGGNILPGGATYDGSGHYVLAVPEGITYQWTMGAHDVSITNGAQTVVANGDFTTQGTTITLNGTAGQLVTAVIRSEFYYTAAECDARFLQQILGAYNAGTTYGIGQLITNQGCLWVAKQVTTGNAPPTLPTTSDSNWLLVVAKGAGSNGNDGANAYLYVGYASDTSGTGFSTSPSSGLPYVAIKRSTTVLTPVVGDFVGLWVKYFGAAGNDGANAYLYVGYASDTSGTGFSTTPSSSLPFIAVKRSTTVLTPVVGDFAGLWVKFLGTDGTGAGDMILAVPQTVTGAKAYSPNALRVLNATSDFYSQMVSQATSNRSLVLPDKDGTLAVNPIVSALAYASTVTVDFLGDEWKQLSLTGDVIFADTNRGSGRSLKIEVFGDTSDRNLTFPGGWRWIAEPKPATLAANKAAILFLFAFGATDADIIAMWWAEGSVTSYQTLSFNQDATLPITPAAGFGVHGVYLTINTPYVPNTPYTAKIPLLRLNASAGDTVDVYVDMPADNDPTVEFFDNVTSGSPIFSFQGRKTAIPVFCKFKYTGTAWKLFQFSCVRNTNVATEYVLDTLTYASSLVIDFDGGSYQIATLTGGTTITTANRASTGFAKAVAVKLIASGADRAFALGSGIVALNTMPATLINGKSNWLSLTSVGPNETDTEAAIVSQP